MGAAVAESDAGAEAVSEADFVGAGEWVPPLGEGGAEGGAVPVP